MVSHIDGRDDSVEFLNGIKIYAGDVIGKVSEDQLRRIQIRETILSHIQRERELFYKGIKVLSLFSLTKWQNIVFMMKPDRRLTVFMLRCLWKSIMISLEVCRLASVRMTT